MTRLFGRSIYVFAVLLLSASGNAQTTTSTIRGSVADPSGAPVPGASIELTETGTPLVQSSGGIPAANISAPGSAGVISTTRGFAPARQIMLRGRVDF